jgi:hypothetical protein
MKPEMIFLCSNFKRGTLFKITEPLAVNRVDLGHWITLAQEQKGELLTNSWIRYFYSRKSISFPFSWSFDFRGLTLGEHACLS